MFHKTILYPLLFGLIAVAFFAAVLLVDIDPSQIDRYADVNTYILNQH